MPTTSVYNHTLKRIVNGEVHWASLKAMILSASASFVAANTTLDAVAGAVSGGHRPKELYGNGWTEGGMAVSGIAVTTTTTNDATVSASDLRVRAAGGAIGGYALVIFDDADAADAPLFYVDFGGVISAGDGTDFLVPLAVLLTVTI